MNLFWFLVGAGIGTCVTGLVLNGRYGRTLDDIEDRFHAMVAEHDHVVRGLISRLPSNDPGRRKSDPLS